MQSKEYAVKRGLWVMLVLSRWKFVIRIGVPFLPFKRVPNRVRRVHKTRAVFDAKFMPQLSKEWNPHFRIRDWLYSVRLRWLIQRYILNLLMDYDNWCPQSKCVLWVITPFIFTHFRACCKTIAQEHFTLQICFDVVVFVWKFYLGITLNIPFILVFHQLFPRQLQNSDTHWIVDKKRHYNLLQWTFRKSWYRHYNLLQWRFRKSWYRHDNS